MEERFPVPLHMAASSKVLSDTEMKYGAPKAEMFAVFKFMEKYRAYSGSAPNTLLVDNRALSWLKIYSMDHSYIGRWIIRLDGFHMKIEKMRDKLQNADNLARKPSSMKDWNRSKPIRQKSRRSSHFRKKKFMKRFP